MQIFFIVFTIVAGVTSALQAGANNTLQKALATPWWTIVAVSAITLVASLVAMAFVHERLPTSQAIATVRWYGWIGGLFGFGFVLATVFASPKLGAGVFVALVVTASTITSLALDHWGLMGYAVHPAGWGPPRRWPVHGRRGHADRLLLSVGKRFVKPTCLAAALALAGASAFATAAPTVTVARLRDGHRLLIVSDATAGGDALTAQRSALAIWGRQAEDRDVVTVTLDGAKVDGASDPATAIRARYAIPARGFRRGARRQGRACRVSRL